MISIPNCFFCKKPMIRNEMIRNDLVIHHYTCETCNSFMFTENPTKSTIHEDMNVGFDATIINGNIFGYVRLNDLVLRWDPLDDCCLMRSKDAGIIAKFPYFDIYDFTPTQLYEKLKFYMVWL